MGFMKITANRIRRWTRGQGIKAHGSLQNGHKAHFAAVESTILA
jgi:hypothetical protein